MPIRIYQFKCNHCGLLYFGKTERKNWKTYKGSGKYWKSHIKKHKSIISKKWLGYFINKETAKIFCLWYSKVKDIVKSDLYANLIEENGLDGGATMTGKTAWNKGIKRKEETKRKISITKKGVSIHTKESKLKLSIVNKGKKLSKEHKLKMSIAHKGKKFNKEHKLKLSKARKGKKQIKVNCPHCNKEGGKSAMKRWHFDNCKLNIN